MEWSESHLHVPDDRFDGGDLDCGNGLLLLIRRHLDPLPRGGLLEILSTDRSVEEDLPAWARLTNNQLLSQTRQGEKRSFLLCKGNLSERATSRARPGASRAPEVPMFPSLAEAITPPVIAPLSVLGIGSWPRPRWMLQSLKEFLQRQLDETAFQRTADDAVRLAIAAQERAGVDVISDGEQRRDSYASFVASRLDNCQLVPVTDLLPYVDDPEDFAEELRALDVPAEEVRHPAVLGRIQRSRPLTVHELTFARRLSSRPVKVALPGPYLLTRTMWLECVADRVYKEREELADDIVSVLRAEIRELLHHGAALVQLDEPVLTEVVFGQARQKRSFMCGALAGRRSTAEELTFAAGLLHRVLEGFPPQRLALHVCRGNWSPDESVALRGSYEPLLELLSAVPVGILFLEMCTPRAGELAVLKAIPGSYRLGLGVVNQKLDRVESVAEVLQRAQQAVDLFGPERLLLNPDCGFATFADNPVSSAEVAEAKLSVMTQVAQELRKQQGLV